MTQKLSEQALENKKRYNADYARKKLKRVPLELQQSEYEELKAAAAHVSEPVNTYIKKAIRMRIQSDE